MLFRNQDVGAIPFETGSAYLHDAAYPAVQVSANEPYILHGAIGMAVHLFPVQFFPAENRLELCSEMIIRLTPIAGSEDSRLSLSKPRDRAFETIFQRHFLNNERFEGKFDFVSEFGRMLIIAKDAFLGDMEDFVDWKQQKGLTVELLPLSQVGNSINAIKSAIQSRYNQPEGLAYILLVGEYNEPVAAIGNIGAANGALADPVYALLEGNDNYPDAFIGRFSGDNSDNIKVQVNKVLYYERDITTSASWLAKGAGIASNQGPGDNGEYDNQHMDIIRNKLLNYGYAVVDQIYDPTANSSMVSNALNEGRGIVNYVGHGSTTSWGSSGFSNSNINSLNNSGKYPYIFSVACVNGNMSYNDCFGEVWLQAGTPQTPKGAIAFYGSSINQSWNPPMAAEDEYIDLLVDELFSTVGALYFHGSAAMIDKYGSSGADMYQTWHLFGDPTLTVRTKTPTVIAAEYEKTLMSGSQLFTLNGEAGEDIFVSLWQGESFLGSAYSDANGLVSIVFSQPVEMGLPVVMTVTGRNKVTLSEELEVITADIPYLVVSAYQLSETNGANGLIEGLDTLSLSFSISNLGNKPLYNAAVSFTSNDSDYISLLAETWNLGTIDSATVFSDSISAICYLSEDVPDGKRLSLNMLIEGTSPDSNGVDSLYQYSHILRFQAVAGVFQLEKYEMTDIDGNQDGRPHSSETMALAFTIKNRGHGELKSGSLKLENLNPELLFLANDSLAFGNLLPGEEINLGDTLSFHLADSLPAQVPAKIVFKWIADGSVSNDTIRFLINPGDFLVWDPDKNSGSGNLIYETLRNELGLNVEYYRDYKDIPIEKLKYYQAVFITLGVYSHTYRLPESEAVAFASYLDQGGNLYLEGGDTWGFDPQTSLHGKFGIASAVDGSSDLRQLKGVSNTLTFDIEAAYIGPNAFIDRIIPSNTAQALLKNYVIGYTVMAGQETEAFNTIAATFELGGVDNSQGQRSELIRRLVNFLLEGGLYNVCPDYAKGDIDQDGKLGVNDLVKMIQFTFYPDSAQTDCQYWAADMDDNHIVNILDVTMGIQHVLKGERNFSKDSGQESHFIVQELEKGFKILSGETIAAADIRLKGLWAESDLPHIEGFRRFTIQEGGDTRIIWLDLSGKGQSLDLVFEDKYSIDVLNSADLIDLAGNFMKQVRAFLPESYELQPVYPNPFNAAVTIPFAVPNRGDISLAIYNIRGQQIHNWTLAQLAPGVHQVQWNSAEAASGIYFVKMKAEAFSQIQKMVLIK